jgi:hypothetical protein
MYNWYFLYMVYRVLVMGLLLKYGMEGNMPLQMTFLVSQKMANSYLIYTLDVIHTNIDGLVSNKDDYNTCDKCLYVTIYSLTVGS